MVETAMIGVGGAGGRIVNRIVEAGRTGSQFAAIDTDRRELDECLASRKLRIGQQWSFGYGIGVPEVGARAALEARMEIGQLCRKSVVVVAGLGAGTGTGAGPVVAGIANACGCEVTAVVTMPFRFEGRERNRKAAEGLAKWNVDRLVTVPLEDMLPMLERSMSLRGAIDMGARVAAKAVELLPLLLTQSGPENTGVVDVRALLALVIEQQRGRIKHR
jgi:cell division protein FtsZ